MAKYTAHVNGDFAQIVDFIDLELRRQSVSLSLEEIFDTQVKGIRISQRAYERFSWAGGNRASLSVLFIETEDGADICGIATGGSQAMFFKINTFGEHAFLETLETAIQNWNGRPV